MIRSTSFDELARSPDILRDLTIAVADYMKKKPREVTMNSRSDSTVNDRNDSTKHKHKHASTVNDLIVNEIASRVEKGAGRGHAGMFFSAHSLQPHHAISTAPPRHDG